jgi:hypothetical protein
MQGYSKCNLGPSITVNDNGQLEASIQGYSMSGLGPSITDHYNG